MKNWTRGLLLATVKKYGYTGAAELPTLKAWMAERNIALALGDGTDGEVDVDAVWNKKVRIIPDAGEEIEVVAEEVTESEDGEGEGEDEVMPKRRRVTAQDIAKSLRGGDGPAVHGHDSFAAGRKRYAAKAARGETLFSDPEVAEVLGATFRLQGAGSAHYNQKRADKEITKAAQVTFDNSLGGALIPDGYIAELIELKPSFGAAARLSGVSTMTLPKEDQPRLVDDMIVDYTAENNSSTERNVTLDTITLVSHEISGHVPISMRQINAQAIDIADILGRSYLRATGRKQDGTYFNGDSKQQGILSKIGANSTFEVTGLSATGLFGVTLDHIQGLMALLPSWCDSYSEDIGFTMTRQVYDATLGRFEANAPGNTKADLRTGNGLGANADRQWGGYPVIFNNTTQKAYATGTLPILFGAFRPSVRFAVLAGSQFMRQSEHAQFLQRNMVWQAGEEFCVNPHDVNNLAGEDGDVTRSGVVALSVAN